MPVKTPTKTEHGRRILGRIAPEEFVGRESELADILQHASRQTSAHGLLLLGAPSAGASELLRQAYDELFQRHDTIIPIYFALSRHDKTSVGAARHFLHTFLLQLTASRRRDSQLVNGAVTMSDLLELASPPDLEWIEHLVEACEGERQRDDERALIRLCLSAPARAAARGLRTMVMIDGLDVAEQLTGEVSLEAEIAQVFMRSEIPFVLSGLRRRLLDLVHDARGSFDQAAALRLGNLEDKDARLMAEKLARRMGVVINEQTRDLVVQQLGGNPSFITSLILAAQDNRATLGSFRDSQHLYVDELMGGRINRHCSAMLDSIAPEPVTRRALVRALFETIDSQNGKSSLESWRKRLDLDAASFQEMMRSLHVHELISLNAGMIETANISSVWQDYLRVRYRLEIMSEARALVVADMLVETLKRAPQTMARHYRRATALDLRELLNIFNCQRVPASLMHYERFSRAYKGTDAEGIHEGLENETELIILPQVVHVASCAAFHPPIQQVIDEERCVVAHGFDGGHYNDSSEVVWIVAEIESKLEAGRGITEMWCDRLEQVGRACGWNRVRLWLVAPEGFSSEASDLMALREVYGSSRQQLEVLTARLSAETIEAQDASALNEFEMVIPMGDETELIAASTLEQIARRSDFKPETINQIKTALVEACINAMEHSLSPDRKIYQRFRLESDRLVITVSSRGVIPPDIKGKNGTNGSQSGVASDTKDASAGRRGWGLKLIRTLMDEVEFERVDDGTRLRMTKYLRT